MGFLRDVVVHWIGVTEFFECEYVNKKRVEKKEEGKEGKECGGDGSS